MKKNLPTFCAILFGITALQAQITTLNYKTHPLKEGDHTVFQCTEYVSPGNGGANQVWDFRDLKFTSEEVNDLVNISQAPHSGFEKTANVATIVTDNYTCYFNVNESGIEQVGYAGKDYKVTYSEPIKRMIYPFTYKSSHSHPFSGQGIYQNSKTDISGNYSIEGDGWGTLYLPNGIVFENVLRVKYTYNKFETTRCALHESHQVKYLYYTKDYNNQVFTVIESQTIQNGDTSSKNFAAILKNIITEVTQAEKKEPEIKTNFFEDNIADYIVFPNPFKETFTINILLKEKTYVSISLFAEDGKFLGYIVEKQLLDAKKYSFDYNANKLPAGAYSVVCKTNDNLVTKKIIKVR